ncbi:MAG: DegT/DnrJ/EryC1/StrS aminotransferase family protein, partial [Desulfobacteraceae bacterium]|nr:DegT/DnrJ/EryC1/StrS aminotransferase family protein [Desulfobacteraceae bacterium]
MTYLVNRLEKYLGENVGTDNIVFTGLTRTSITVALKAMGISAGDEVIMPAFICRAVEKAVILSGAKPVYVDLNRNSLDINMVDMKKVLSNRSRALIVNHSFGYQADAEKFRRFCDDNNLYLIEDCVSSFVVDYQDERKKIYGDIAVFSIYKMLV